MRTDRYYALTSQRETYPNMTSEDVANHVAAFLAGGGTVTQVPSGMVKGADPFRLFTCHECGGTGKRAEGTKVCAACRDAEVGL